MEPCLIQDDQCWRVSRDRVGGGGNLRHQEDGNDGQHDAGSQHAGRQERDSSIVEQSGDWNRAEKIPN